LRTRQIVLSFLIIFLINPHSFSAETRSGKNVLILFAMAPSTPAYQVISAGIRSNLAEAFGDMVSFHMEYLEIESFPDGKYPRERFELINEKFDKIDVDLLICVGVDIISTVKRCASRKILDLPVITIDYDLADFGGPLSLKLNEKNAVIGIKPNILGTLKSAVNLFPGRNHLYIISGSSNTDLMYLKLTEAMVSQLGKEMKLNIIDSISMDEVLNLVHNLQDNCMIFIPGFNTDSKQVFYYNPEAIRLISQAANAPVFSISDMGFGEGEMGGYILSFRKTGLLAGEIAVKMLNGLNPSSVKVTEKDYYDQLYDWRQLKRWNLTGSNLIPKGSKIEFEETNIIKEYKWFITSAIVFLVLQFLMILNLIRMNRKQRSVTSQLIITENKYRDLVNEDRLLRLSQLTASLSHELNQPLTAILSTAQAGLRIMDSGQEDPELLKEIFRNIVEDDKRTAAILSSIRGMMKLEKRDKEKVNLNELIVEIVEICRSEAVMNSARLLTELTDKPVYVFADLIQIQQVLMNFLTNAVHSVEKYNKTDGQVKITESTKGDFVTVSVRDSGEGIDISLKEKLFKPFITTKKEGSGIGLAISRSIIEDHEGKIWGENRPGGGAEFSFSLKIYQDE
jgi:signal transduction histidine kinase